MLQLGVPALGRAAQDERRGAVPAEPSLANSQSIECALQLVDEHPSGESSRATRSSGERSPSPLRLTRAVCIIHLCGRVAQGFLSALILCAVNLAHSLVEQRHQSSAAPNKAKWALLVLSDSEAFPSLVVRLPELRGKVITTEVCSAIARMREAWCRARE